MPKPMAKSCRARERWRCCARTPRLPPPSPKALHLRSCRTRSTPSCSKPINNCRQISLPLDRHHAALLDRERQPALLKRERLLAEKVAPPAVQGRHVGRVVAGDAVEIVDGGDHLGGD